HEGAGDRRRRRSAALAACRVAAYVMRPTNAIPLVLLTAWTAVRRPRLLPAHLGGATAVAAAFVAVNLATFDRLLPPYYAGNRLGLPGSLGDAFAANLVSPNRALLVSSL